MLFDIFYLILSWISPHHMSYPCKQPAFYHKQANEVSFAFTVWSCHAAEAGEMLCDKTKHYGCKGDYSKHGTNAVYFGLKLFRQQGLFHINWKELICPLLKDIFVGNFESLGYFYVSNWKNQSLKVSHFNPPI